MAQEGILWDWNNIRLFHDYMLTGFLGLISTLYVLGFYLVWQEIGKISRIL